MKFRLRILLLPLLAILLVGYQNCGGNLQAVVSSQWIAGSGGGGQDFLDGLPAGISQSGKAFVRDPGSDTGNQALPFSTNLANYGSATTIKHLKNLGYLSNGYINVNLDTAYPGQLASPQSSLVFAPTTPRFQQVNAYFHIDTLIADLAGMGMFPASYTPIKVDAHCVNTDSKNNAYYSFTDHQLCMGYTDLNSKRIWAADDQDVTVHEFGHSLNHTFSTTDIITSTPDLGAIDEGFADLWAYRQSLDPKVSVWFGRAIYAYYNQSMASLRDLSVVTNYPAGLVDEVHDDSSFISGAVYQIENDASVSTLNKTKLEKRMLEDLQFGHGLQDAIVSLQDEAADLGIDPTIVSSALSTRGLLRNDDVNQVQLNATKPAFPIDTYKYTFMENGNCNGALDAGETLLLYPNLENTGAIKGGIALELSTATPNVSVLAGGDYGFVNRIKANTSFQTGELTPLNKNDATQLATYYDRMLAPSFVIKADAGATGTATFNLKISTMNTIGGVANTRIVSFTLPIGSVGPTANCTNTAVLP